MDKEIIRRNFSRCAEHYDKYCTAQNLCGQTLITMIKADNFKNIFEPGCGTGNYTLLLREKFPQAYIKAVDISTDMLRKAKERMKEDKAVEFIVADAEEIYFAENFNLISSNAAFQWFTDLKGTLLKYKDLLTNRGIILFSQFGSFTFFELNESLKKLLGKAFTIDSHNFIEKRRLKEILQRLFEEVKIESKIFKEKCNSLTQLLRKIKYTGVRGNGASQRIAWTPGLINELEKIYKEKFKDIIVTYEVFFCQGVK